MIFSQAQVDVGAIRKEYRITSVENISSKRLVFSRVSL